MRYSQDKQYVIEILNKNHNRQQFNCGINSLGQYISKQANQDMKKNIAVTYILEDFELKQIAGYYTLSSTTIQLCDLPNDIIKKLPRYPHLPATLIGRLAVDVNYQKKGIGEILLIDSLQQTYNASKNVASLAVIVDAINESAVKFYEKYGFTSFASHKNKLYMPMKQIAMI